MATQISIGATAQAKNTKDLTATSLQKWNKGLVDRFNTNLVFNTNTNSSLADPLFDHIDKIQKLEKVWMESGLSITDKLTVGLTNLLPTNPLFLGTLLKITEKKVKSFNYKNRSYENVTKEKFVERAMSNNYLDEQKEALKSAKSLKYSTVYKEWQQKIFGDLKPNGDVPYIKFSSTIYNEGKKVFENYLNDYYNKKFNNNNISNNHIGFIPVELELTLDGISGIKIYQQLKIRQQFLPKSYPESLGFLITKVNHKISNNSWDTIIGTLSTSNIDSNPTDKPEEEANKSDIIEETPQPPVLENSNTDFWTLVAISAAENYADNPQGMADVAQSIYNRLSARFGYGNSIKQIVTGKNQYEPTFGNPNDWKNIQDYYTAVVAYQNSRKVSFDAATKVINTSFKALTTKTYQDQAKIFVGSRTEFLAQNPTSNEAVGVVVRPPDKRNNNFFWRYDGKNIFYDKGITTAQLPPKNLFS